MQLPIQDAVLARVQQTATQDIIQVVTGGNLITWRLNTEQATWYFGSGAPGVISQALAGNFYLDNTGLGVYEYNGTSWTEIGSITGGGAVTSVFGRTGAVVAQSGDYSAAQLTNGVTGSGAVALATSPTLVTPILGTPTSGNLANCTFPTLNQNTSGTAANLSGTPALPNGTTATTQTVGDNTTKLATTAFVIANAGGGGSSAFNAITSGTNTTAAMVLGTGATLTEGAGTVLDKGNLVYNVKAYGAVGNGSTDDTTSIQNAINAADATGGTVYFPNGTYKITAALKLFSGTTPTIVAYTNINFKGAGSAGGTGSIIAQATTGLDCFQGINDAANGAQALNITFEDINVTFSGTATNSGNGWYLKQQAANSPAFQGFTFNRCSATGLQGSGKFGFNIEGLIVSTLRDCQATNCANGFLLNGTSNSGNFNSVSTSVTFENCYANGCLVTGFQVSDSTYINFNSTACDFSATSAGSGYLIQGCQGIGFNNCGTELDGTHTLSSAWRIDQDSFGNPSSGIQITGCFINLSKSTKEVYVTGSSTGVTVTGFTSSGSISGSTGLTLDAAAQATEMDCNWDASGIATKRTINAAATWMGGPTAGAMWNISDGASTSTNDLTLTNATVSKTGAIGAVSASLTKSFADGVNPVSFSATPVFDLSLGNTQTITLTGNVTSSTFSNAIASRGQRTIFIITQDGTGGRSFIWPTSAKGITPIINTAASSVSIVEALSDGTNLNWVGTQNCVPISSQNPASDTVAAPANTTTNFTTSYTIPANTLITGVTYRVQLFFKATTSASPPNSSFVLNMNATAGYASAQQALTASLTGQGVGISFLIVGTAAAGASANVNILPQVSLAGASLNPFNNSATAIPLALPTNASIVIHPAYFASAATAGNSLQLMNMLVERLA